MKNKEIVFIKKGKHFAQLTDEVYNSPKKFSNGLTQKEICAKNGYRLATEAEINAHLKIEVEKPKEVKESKKEPKVKKVDEIAVQETDNVSGESHD